MITTTAAPTNPLHRTLRRLGANTRYVLIGFPVSLLSFSVLVVGFSLGAGLLVVALGFPVLGLTVYAARGFADVERLRLGLVTGGERVRRPSYERADPGRGLTRRVLAPLAQPQGWLDLLHGVGCFVVSTVAFVLTVTWWALAVGGLTYWFWERFLPPRGNQVVVEAVLGSYSHAGEIALFTTAGLVGLITLPAVVGAVAAMRSAFTRTLLVDLAAYRRDGYRP